MILGLVSDVAEAYFNLRGLDYEVEITKRTLKSWEESVRLSELRFKQGAIPKLDLDRFQAERAGAAAQLADLSGKSSKKKTGSASCLAADRRRLREGSASPSNRFLLPSRPDSRRIFFNGVRTS